VFETKVKYQGYVFAKLRLCSKTYEAIQGTYRNCQIISWTVSVLLILTNISILF
jgi:hypothetical protein